MQNDSVNYFLFPHLAASEMELRNLFVFLPHCNLLEITQPAPIPEWGRERFHSWPVVRDAEFRATIASCVREYRAFAEIHGGTGGTLGYLTQALDATGETRLEIQEELRGKCPTGMDQERLRLLKAAVFLEIARELDEREYELEASYAHLNALEEEFRGILGITPDEDGPEAEETLSPPLLPDAAGRLFMIARRMESWLQLFATRGVDGIPVFVTNSAQVIEEALEVIRTASERAGKKFTAERISLGSFPRVDQLGQKQFRSLMEAPGMPALLSSYWESLDAFIREAGDAAALKAGSVSLRNQLDKFCRKCEAPGEGQVSLVLMASETLRLGDIMESFGIAGAHAVPGNLPFSFLCVE